MKRHCVAGERMNVRIRTLPFRESGRCPKCKMPATYRLVEFDSRTYLVTCSGFYGQFNMPQSVLDDALEGARPEEDRA